MKKFTWRLNILLIVEVFALSAALLLTEAFAPSAILPKNSIPMMVLLSAVALAAEFFESSSSIRLSVKSVISNVSFEIL